MYPLLTRILVFLGEVCADAIVSLFDRRDTGGGFEKLGRVASRFNKGFAVGSHYLSVKASHTHLICAGGSGAGKTASVIIPSILNARHSLVINDPSGELYANTAGFLASKGFAIKVLNYSEPDCSDRYNPLHRVVTPSDAQKVAAMIVKNALGSGGNDTFWNSQAAAFLTLLIMILKTKEPQYCNFANCKHVLDQFSAEPQFVDKLVASCKDDTILKEYKVFLRYDSKVMANIIATCRSALSLWNDPHIQSLMRALVYTYEEIETGTPYGDYISSSEQNTTLYQLASFAKYIRQVNPGDFPLLSSEQIDSIITVYQDHLAEILSMSAADEFDTIERQLYSIQYAGIVAMLEYYQTEQPEDLLSLYRFTEEQIGDLEDIANLCPLTYGHSVYEARAVLFYMLGRLYHNECEPSLFDIGPSPKITQEQEEQNIILYPNPVTSEVYIQIPEEMATTGVNIRIFDFTGRLAEEINTHAEQTRLDMAGYASGTYVIRIVGNNGRMEAHKIIKM